MNQLSTTEPKPEKNRIVEASYVISSPDLRHCPAPELPEIAVAGRSNVGKSSLINLLCNRRNLAKTSGTPGKTRLINFFHIRVEPETRLFHLVDLPGYGYSKVSKSMQMEWNQAMGEFMEKRGLRGILHLVDARHKPSELDLQMREWILQLKIPAITVLTKMDKLKKNELAKNRKIISEALNLSPTEPCILTSATKKNGIQELLNALVGWLER